jgi:hypothetical protein
MPDTNFIGSIVKILELPNQKTLANNLLITTFRVQFPQVRGTSIVSLKFLGNIGKDIIRYYKVNDYILIEGYLKLKNQKLSNLSNQKEEQIEITVLRIYPIGSNFTFG